MTSVSTGVTIGSAFVSSGGINAAIAVAGAVGLGMLGIAHLSRRRRRGHKGHRGHGGRGHKGKGHGGGYKDHKGHDDHYEVDHKGHDGGYKVHHKGHSHSHHEHKGHDDHHHVYHKGHDDHKHVHHKGHDDGYHEHHESHKGHDDSYHRKKRSATREAEALSNSLNLIRQEDFTGCGLRLMCELAGKDPEELTEEELVILDLVGPVVRPGEGILPKGGAGDYTRAKALGYNGANCAQLYPLCPLDGTQLMNTVMEFIP